MTHFVKKHAILMALAAISMTLGSMPAHAIVGGEPTTIQQHPWQVQIITNLGDNEHKTMSD
jgi:hypothetical protein